MNTAAPSSDQTDPTRPSSVEKTGSGIGTVTSTPAGIDCGGDCLSDYDYGTEISLSADPGPHSLFVGWGGPCSGSADCVVTMDQARQVTAEFAMEKRTLDVSSSGNGSGRVTSQPAGVDCGGSCEGIQFDYGTEVTLTATPSADTSFSGWSGDCSGGGVTCSVTLDEARTVEAKFDLQKRSLTVTTSGTGSGTVTANPPGSTFDHGTYVTLEAASAKGSTFTGWGGACSGTAPSCTLTMDEARTVDAGFKLDASPPGVGPVIRKLKVAPRKVKLKGKSKSAVRNKGPLVTIKLSEAATVRLSLRGKKGKTRSFKRARVAGTSRFRLPGKIRKKLKPGRYRLTAVATDKAGRISKVSKTAFRVVR